uniref:Secreted protein n=1 Tax=Gongylonema pulchrum TaxID=637853 RepID=A0A183D7R9_9BILA
LLGCHILASLFIFYFCTKARQYCSLIELILCGRLHRYLAPSASALKQALQSQFAASSTRNRKRRHIL